MQISAVASFAVGSTYKLATKNIFIRPPTVVLGLEKPGLFARDGTCLSQQAPGSILAVYRIQKASPFSSLFTPAFIALNKSSSPHTWLCPGSSLPCSACTLDPLFLGRILQIPFGPGRDRALLSAGGADRIQWDADNQLASAWLCWHPLFDSVRPKLLKTNPIFGCQRSAGGSLSEGEEAKGLRALNLKLSYHFNG